MPLKLVPPGPRSANYRVRGTYLRQYVDTTTGTATKTLAIKIFAQIKGQIERGIFRDERAATFAEAAAGYEAAGGSKDFLKPLLKHLGSRTVDSFTQAVIDTAAINIKPDASAATRNRQVYTPISTILRHAGVKLDLRRPKGAKGRRRTFTFRQQEAFALLSAATQVKPAFGALLTFYLYTGCRLSEALRLTHADINLAEATAYIRQTKTDGARSAHLPPIVVAALGNLRIGSSRRDRVFALSKSGYLYNLLKDSIDFANRAEEIEAARLGLSEPRFVIALPERVKFHAFRHTWGTWMRKYAGMDTSALVETGAWRSREAASIYEHMDTTEEARKAELLPMPEQSEIRAKSVIVPLKKA